MPEVTEPRVEQQADDPLAVARQVREDIGRAHERRREKPEQQPEGGAGKDAQRQPLEHPVDQHQREAENQSQHRPDNRRTETILSNRCTDDGSGDDEKRTEEIDG